MSLPKRSATKLASASLMLIAVFAIALVARSQEIPQGKPSPLPDKSSSPAAEESPTPPQKQRLGTELDGPVIHTNTDLITLTVTVTDTYGRYVSGLNKTAFSIFDDKQPQEITYFSDDDS
ncbi:MAG TPA: hypothetical protein VLE19_04230, partial [Pyrinomonadaceae bacterium]|nr:hypothetical protein [Pyrinomonadaceae bacterium]